MSEYPRPVGWRILIKPTTIDPITEGGIALPESAVKDKEYLQYTGQVVAMGNECYRHEKFEGSEPWCRVGDHIVFGQYSGQQITVNVGGEQVQLKCINDDEVIAVTSDPGKLIIK